MSTDLVETKSTNPEKKQMTKEAIINAFSNILFLFCLWLMSMIVPKISPNGFEDAGIFTLALSVASIATAIATYNIGSFFASDVNDRFKDNHYFYFGMTSTLISLLVAVVICFIYGYAWNVFLAIIFYNIFKMFDNYSFITRIIYHKHGHLLTFSVLLIGRSILSLGVFVASIFIFKNLMISMAALAVLGFLYFFLELFFLRKKSPGFYTFNGGVYKTSLSIFYFALPVCIYGLCIASIVAIPRLLFENVTQNTSLLGYFGTMSSVTALIQAVTSAILLPFIPKIASSYLNSNRKSLSTLLGVLFIIVSLITVIAFLMVLFLGNWALKLVYGEEIINYSSIFKWLVLSAGLQSLLIVLADTLVSLRKFKFLLIGTVSSLVVMASIMFPLIKSFGDYGVTYVYFISFGTGFVLLLSFLTFVILKMRPDKGAF